MRSIISNILHLRVSFILASNPALPIILGTVVVEASIITIAFANRDDRDCHDC